MDPAVWFSILIVGFISLLMPFILRRFLIKRAVFDIPNARSSHVQPTVRGGGAAALLGFVIGALWIVLARNDRIYEEVVFILFLSAFMGLIGLIEDIKGLKIAIRASLQLFAGLALGFFLWNQFDISPSIIPFLAFLFAFHVNITNFMDGVNGISGLHGFVVGISFVIFGVMYSSSWLMLVGGIIAIAFITFLPWNLSPPGMFLGDVGSYLLGASIATTALIALSDGVHPLAVFAPISIYWADTVFTLGRRMINRAPIFKAHRSHIYQQLTDTGLSHIQVAIMVALFTVLATCISSLVVLSFIPLFVGALLILAVIILYLYLPKLRGN